MPITDRKMSSSKLKKKRPQHKLVKCKLAINPSEHEASNHFPWKNVFPKTRNQF